MERQVDGKRLENEYLDAMVIAANNADKMKESYTLTI